MPDWLLSIPAFIVAIGVLVAVHEYGHLWVARRMGVRILRYSLGFGPKLWGRTSRTSGTEYWISALPLGGYVKMLDEREAPVADEDKPYAFNRQHPLKRIAIVVAGPGVNFLFAIFAYWLVLMLGVHGLKPIIGPVPEDSIAAQAELVSGDQIVALDQERIESWQDLRLTLLDRALDHAQVQVSVVDQQGAQHTTSLDLRSVSEDPDKLFEQLGLAPYQPPSTPLIARVLPDSPAAAAGLQDGDQILAVDGEKMRTPQMLVEWIQAHPGTTAEFRIRRDGGTRTLAVTLGQTEREGQTIGQLGAAIGVDSAAWEAMRTTQRLGPLAAVPAAFARTWDVSALTLRLMGQMVIGNVSWRNISGPVQIASFAGQTASMGLTAFLSFMALVSVSLGIINLLPIPVLDGGHLLYYALEWIRGKPLSEAVQAAGQQAGLLALLLLMTLAFYNDILRLLG